MLGDNTKGSFLAVMVNRGAVWGVGLCESYSWRREVKNIGSRVASLIVKGSEGREYWN